MLPFLLISASLKQLSRDITNNVTVKQRILGVMYFLLNSKIQKFPWKRSLPNYRK